MIYQSIIRPFLFTLEPERAHRTALGMIRIAQKVKPLRDFLASKFEFQHSALEQDLFGHHFRNPIGLAAGYDKNCEVCDTLSCFGFGFVECGTVTSRDQSGNPTPRVFRLEEDQALINRLGFNNRGALWVENALRRRKPPCIPMGINIGKSKATELERAAEDYLFTFEKLYPYAGYFAVNVSSPNTPQLRELQKNLSPLLAAIQAKNQELARKAGTPPKPILVKISPDVTVADLEQICAPCERHAVAGLIATNTTTARDGLHPPFPAEGGLSGKPLEEKSTAVLRDLYRMVGKKMTLIGVGGIFTAKDAYRKLRSGASLLQIYTGWVYGGPSTILKINQGLVEFLKRDGFANVREAVGADAG